MVKFYDKDSLNKFIQVLGEKSNSCDTELPYNIPVVMHYLNIGLHEGSIDEPTHLVMLERIRNTAENYGKKCNCHGVAEAPIREKHPEEIMDKIKILKKSVESCSADTPLMTLNATSSLGTHRGYIDNVPSYVASGFREILNSAVEFKLCSCAKKE